MQVENRGGGDGPKLKQYLSRRHGKQHWSVEESVNLESLSLSRLMASQPPSWPAHKSWHC